MTKYSRSGGKFSGNHTTLSPTASVVADIASQCSSVTKISPGFLKSGLKSANGNRRLKIRDNGVCIVLQVRDNISHQEIYVYVSDMQAAKLAIAKGARNAGLAISFNDKE
ncbi:hypothetical protein A2392_00980 [Candidatus Kaiserbacteria bacterium RIFOXYB1_FULL_46_14]|uniref:Uncharacterized protein n=1 Tax=Candidatus Kaiserbacteria bacterium RIFOXYB1_FULL_46_14 TaxID=1798531 RepID=A0A1F6FJJ3_9BACT|nr:MAG: hypothetical protein A2392_00980 [Candidatus Kaiserbacteria bacterium RIFOXYB1_FULL_46_14]